MRGLPGETHLIYVHFAKTQCQRFALSLISNSHGPHLAGDEQPMRLGVIGDAVQHIDLAGYRPLGFQ